MRTTLTIDDDVAGLIQRVQAQRDVTFRQVVNEALRAGLAQMERPAVKRRTYRTRPVDLGTCRFPNLDNVWDVLTEAEDERQ